MAISTAYNSATQSVVQQNGGMPCANAFGAPENKDPSDSGDVNEKSEQALNALLDVASTAVGFLL
ncbi:hypothetical protein AB3X96_38780 [Paraburkholderia sp. BR13439]|uniref:hypothetical protein n=1 Tax=Paraburkholderia TaxID=1822464 RepID=UPI0034CE96EE